MKTVDTYLAAAAAALIQSDIVKGNTIAKAYKGAVASFGASLVMSGLVPTIQFYMADSSGREVDYKLIVKAIARIVEGEHASAEALQEKIMTMLREADPNLRRLWLNTMKAKILDAAVALKIMMRSYEFTGGDAV